MFLFLPPFTIVVWNITCKINADRLILVKLVGLTILAVRGRLQPTQYFVHNLRTNVYALSRAVSKMHNACVPLAK